MFSEVIDVSLDVQAMMSANVSLIPTFFERVNVVEENLMMICDGSDAEIDVEAEKMEICVDEEAIDLYLKILV